jgi:hypothetical protein
MTSLLPQDTNGNPIPTLRLKDGGAHKININGTSAKNTAPLSLDTDVIGLYATEDSFIKIGTDTVTASDSDHFIPAGTYFDIALGPNETAQNSYIAAITTGVSGTLYISEKT